MYRKISRSGAPVLSLFTAFLFLSSVPLFAQPPPAAKQVRLDTYKVSELRLQRMESVWPDRRAVTTRQAGGAYAATLFDRSGRTLSERWIVPQPPLAAEGAVTAGDATDANVSISRANELLERQSRHDAIGNDAAATRDRMPSRVTMDFGDFIADSFRDPIVPPHDREEGRSYSTFHTNLLDGATGEQIGILRWFRDQQVLVWRIEKMGAIGEGLITPERLAKVGGWKFTPDIVWAGIQVLALRDSADRVTKQRTEIVADLNIGPLSCDGVSDGCTGLHWLDGTIYQQCCDAHDLCYEYAPPDGCCSALSWIFPYPWRCVLCNIQVVECFLTTGGGGGPGGGGGGGGGGGCTTGGQTPWCPPECMSCGGMYY